MKDLLYSTNYIKQNHPEVVKQIQEDSKDSKNFTANTIKRALNG